MPIIRSISGLRATLSDSCLSEKLIINYAIAFHKFCTEGEIIIGRDGRPSGKKIELILNSIFSSLGRKVKFIGLVPSPTVQLITEQENAAGGISITASHNPDDWNGLKFINSKGIFLDEKENELLWSFLDDSNLPEISRISEEVLYSDVCSQHINSILSLPYLAKEIDKIQIRKYKVVVDAVNASGSFIVPQLLNNLGCVVVPLYCEGTGVFPHLPEPLPQNLTELASAVKREKADLGISVDPDADRLVLIDENGEPIGEENTIVLSVQSVISFAKENDLDSELIAVVNHSTTQGVEYIAGKFGAKVERAAVGEINVVKKMISKGAVVGGEGSGGVILPECHYGRDSLVGIALILSLLSRTNKSLSELRNDIPKYAMVKDKFHFEGDFNILSEKVKEIFDNCKVIEEDGLKFIFEDSWLQIRKSNTEPIVRIIAEGIENEYINQLINKVKETIHLII